MKKAYPALFHADDNGYWIEFPDLEGCLTEGGSIEEAVNAAEEALRGYLISAQERGLPIPEPSDIRSYGLIEGGFASMVSYDPLSLKSRGKSVKKTLTIPEWLNDAAEERSINFSQVLQKALISILE